MPMSRPRVDWTISAGQILTSVLLAVIIAGGGWIATKDRNDADLGAKIDAQAAALTQQGKDTTGQISGVTAQLSRLDGKLEAYSASLNALSGRVDLIDQRVRTSEDDGKEGRKDRLDFQRSTDNRIGQLEQRVGVVEALRSARP